MMELNEYPCVMGMVIMTDRPLDRCYLRDFYQLFVTGYISRQLTLYISPLEHVFGVEACVALACNWCFRRRAPHHAFT